MDGLDGVRAVWDGWKKYRWHFLDGGKPSGRLKEIAPKLFIDCLFWVYLDDEPKWARPLYLQYLFIATVRKCVICRVHCNLYEFSFTKISKFPTVAFLRYSISNEFCLVYFSRIRSIKLWIKIHNYGVFMAFYGVFNLYWGFYFVLQIPWKVTYLFIKIRYKVETFSQDVKYILNLKI